MTDYAVQMTGIRKRFGGVHALRGADLAVRRGECHALIGANGAGKSTLAGILGGSLRPDGGRICLFGEQVVLRNPHEGMAAGVGVVPQEPLLAMNMTLADNIMLGRENGRRMGLDHQSNTAETLRLLEQVGLDLAPDTPMAELDIAQQQLAQVARALGRDAKILILDEPTSAITTHECERLFQLISELRAGGVTLIYVSHRLPEVFRLADRVSVMRDGLTVRVLEAAETTREELIAAMAGEAQDDLQGTAQEPRARANRAQTPLLDVDGLATRGKFGPLSFRLWHGEILGIAGLVGAGRSELAHGIAGVVPPTSGTTMLNGRFVVARNAAHGQRNGIVLLPEDRKAQGLIGQLTVRENISLSTTPRLSGALARISSRRERDLAHRYRELLSIQCSGIDQPVRELSGGNQQKVLLARALACEPQVLVLDEPTRGVDVRAKADMHHWVRDLAGRGMGVILISSELEEVVALSDRILVMREGRLVHEVSGAEATPRGILTHAAGRAPEQAPRQPPPINL